MNARSAVVAASVRRLYACTALQALLGMALAASFVAGAAWLQRHALAGLFVAMLGPALLACAVLLACARLAGARFGWVAAWCALLLSTGAGALAVLAPYRAWVAAHGIPGLPDPQVLACAFGFGMLALGLPLWHAQIRARGQQLAGLRHALLAAELKALQAQVEPHFLYNTLANARYLARQQPQQAAQMLEHLISYLHSALPDMRRQDSTLGREFELAGHYLALMAIRYGDRLSYRVDCPPELADLAIPPLLLMTLVENAVKHGAEPKPGPVRIGLAASRQDDLLRIVVSDDGAGPGATALGSGVGLRNLRQRLHALYGERAGFELTRTGGGLTEAALVLPLAATGLEISA